jgi:hypothetical protein
MYETVIFNHTYIQYFDGFQKNGDNHKIAAMSHVFIKLVNHDALLLMCLEIKKKI